MRRPYPGATVRICLLAALFSASALYEAWRPSSLANVETWLHLRTGFWILQNHAVPHTGIFSQYPELPWIDSTWGSDVLLALAYKLLGLRAIPFALMGFKAALAFVTFLLARCARAGVWTAVILSAIGQYVISGLQPVPAVFSILFFAVELALLLGGRTSGDIRTLFWLPPLFLLWANLHIQFVCGLIVLALFAGALWIEQLPQISGITRLHSQSLPLPKLALICAISFVATLFNPYSFHLIPNAPETLYSNLGFEHFAEMRSMNFRHPQEFLLMLLVMAAFFALGTTRRLRVFESMLLIAGTAVAFRIHRDAWLVVLPAIAVLAGGFHDQEAAQPQQTQVSRWEKTALAAIVVAVLGVTVSFLPNNNVLTERVTRNFPAKACDFISQNRLRGPVFNAYSWGDFLTWYLPQYPVVIDSRVELYRDQILSQYFDVTAGKDRLDSDPKLVAAQILLLEKQSGMAKALTGLPALSSRYRLVYSDAQAAVFVRQ